MDNRPTTDDRRSTTNLPSPWPHRWAWVVACGVFPLIWMGGLVTTYNAGMAVPDWPTTYDSWFYPLQKWIWKVSSDLFLEHGHRTLAQLVGLASIFLVVAVFRGDGRKSARRLAIIILAGLLFQGTLGGFRVRWDERLLARIHGCTAPIIFCLCVLMVAITSKTWRDTADLRINPAARRMLWLAPILTGLIYLEIVFGTLLRHPLIDAWTNWSLFWIWSKVITVGVLFLGMCYLLFLVPTLPSLTLVPTLPRGNAIPRRSGVADTPTDGQSTDFSALAIIRRRIFLLASLFVLQVILACTTWVANYGWPKWFTDNFVNWNYTVVKEGVLQVWITTAHAAVGSLVLVSAFNLTVWTRRLLRGPKG
ncbi:MAG: COX15/CtaA family protein [Pirellulales bacterium]|nr:COX15/CtaA family protein [Pirellulales bacterium]